MNLRLNMQTQTISVKELRNNFPAVIKALERGTDYTLIYRSKPVAHISPVVSSSHEGLRKLLELAPSLRFRSKKSAVELVREERD